MAHAQLTLQPGSWTELAAATDVIEMMQTHSPVALRYIHQNADPTADTPYGEGIQLEQGDSVTNWTLDEKLWGTPESTRDTVVVNLRIA